MIPWWWVIIALIVGEAVGIIVTAICSANERDNNHKYIK